MKLNRTWLFAVVPCLALALSVAMAAPSAATRASTVSPDWERELVADESTVLAAQSLLATVDRPDDQPVFMTEDDALVSLSLANFAGVWADDTDGGQVVSIAVVASGENWQSDAEAVLLALRSAPTASQRSVPALAALRSPRTQVAFVPANYSFTQLKTWQASLNASPAFARVSFTDADERHNTVTIGLPTNEDEAYIRAYATELAIPQNALRFITIDFHTSLADDHRPLAGGQQIQYAFPVVGSLGTIFHTSSCSLGLPVNIANTSPETPGYITNSHCSIDYAEADYVYHWQPSIPFGSMILTGNRIGFEVLDPPLFTVAHPNATPITCPSGQSCRLSDVSYGMFEPGYTGTPPGYIAKTNSLGSNDWNGSDRFRVMSVANPSGTLRKVGRSAGMTEGTLLHSCVDANNISGYPAVTQLCQYIASYESAPGDSGGPVFRVTNLPVINDVEFVGLHWGRGELANGDIVALISSWPNTLIDFWPYDIRVCAGGAC